jgi:exonuclease SbcD
MHFADAHFGVENYGRFDPETGLNSRLVDFRNALRSAIETALTADIEIAVFSGDAYKTRDPSQTHQREFAACLSLLTARGVPVVLLAGNHDIPNTKGRANAIEIFGALGGDLVHVIDAPRVLRLRTRGGHPVQVAGMPYLIKSLVLSRDAFKDKGVQETTQLIVDRYAAGIDHLAAACDTDVPTILLGHFSVTNARLSANQVGYLTNEPEVPLSILAREPFDYVALGHIHRYQDLNRGGQPPVVYSGSVERIDFGEIGEQKGFVIGELSKGYTEFKHLPVETRPFVEIDVDVTGAEETVTERLLEAIGKQSVRGAIVKMSYKIKSEQLPHLREPDIRSALGDAFMVVALHKDVQRDSSAVRSKLLTESLDPIQALSTYLETRETLKNRKDELLAYADALVRELEADEALR